MIHSLSSGEHLDERFWFIQISQAVAWSILHLRFGRDDQTYRPAARQALERAQLVPGCQALTAQQLRDDWVLAHKFGLHAPAFERQYYPNRHPGEHLPRVLLLGVHKLKYGTST